MVATPVNLHDPLCIVDGHEQGGIDFFLLGGAYPVGNPIVGLANPKSLTMKDESASSNVRCIWIVPIDPETPSRASTTRRYDAAGTRMCRIDSK